MKSEYLRARSLALGAQSWYILLSAHLPGSSAYGLDRETAEAGLQIHAMLCRCQKVMSGCKGTTSSIPQTPDIMALYHMPSYEGVHS